jgi:hypothetical protein
VRFVYVVDSQFSILNLDGWQFDAECGAEAEFGAFDEDFAVVVLFDDAFGKGESESPSALFGGVAWLED